MAKRRYRKTYRSRKRWSPNIKTLLPISGEGRIQFPANSHSASSLLLCLNPAQNVNSISQTFTVKNIEFSFTAESTSENSVPLENLTIYIMFIPQGYNLDALHQSGNFLDETHPEWIMAYKYYGSPSSDFNQTYQPFRVKTRLSRKLQTGDGIILYIKGYNPTSTIYASDITGILRWWTKAS